ncbi:MAG TPA: hypothetical protein VII99_10530 [Bacteroidia bacterium]
MPNTDQYWQADTPFPDQEIFVGATEFKDLAGVATFASAGAGLLSLNLGTAAAGNFFANITAALKRTGVLATPALQQSQFGTGASMPGPSGVANTTDPEGIRGFPPFPASKLPTLIGAQTGPIVKGIQVNSVDLLYNIGTVNAGLAQVGLTITNFIDNNAATPTSTNIIALGANGMPTAFRANYYRFNVPVTSPAMVTAFDSELIANVKLTAGSGGTVVFYGMVAKCSFNFA